jgi:hypothetical protein
MIRRVVPASVLAVLLAACGSASDSPSPSDAPSPPPSLAPVASAGETRGISLAEADLDLLLDAFAGYGFEMVDEPEAGSGGNVWTGTAHDGAVEVVLIETGGEVQQVGVFDYSAGEEGLDELGFLIGIFAPEAQAWLVEQATRAVDDPGTELRVREEFDLVTLEFDAFVDETQSLDLWIEAPDGGS